MLEDYLFAQTPRNLTGLTIYVVRELTRVMCIALGGDFYIIQNYEEEDHTLNVYVRNLDGVIYHVEIWYAQASKTPHGRVNNRVNNGMATRLETEEDLARILRSAKGLGSDPVMSPPPPPVLVDYAGNARVGYVQ